MCRPSVSLRVRFLALVLGSSFTVAIAAAETAPIIVPRFTHPGAGQTYYFVLTDRFANGDPANDQGGLSGGADVTGFDPTRISHYHGGDFAGLTARLDYLQNLGVTSVWVTPPFRNKPMQQGTAGYHGYWITDFLAIDPHLGTNDEFRAFVAAAHDRGMRVTMDIIVNHTADVIQLQGDYAYRPIKDAPYRDAVGQPFDARAVAFNGLNDPAAFPVLAAETSFPYRPWIPAGEETVKSPAWLNDVTLYHNRGNTTFTGENSTHGDFVGLDDLFTEHPRVVRGFIDIFTWWQREFGVDAFRIDTVRHVDTAFWQAFAPAIAAQARELGRPDFVQFAEVYNDAGDPAVLSEFSTNTLPIDTTLDFGFFVAARKFVAEGGTAAALADFFARDDHYIDHDSNVHTTTTFLGNHDAGRFAYFLAEANPGASPAQLAALVELGHGLLFFARGQPVIYYGDEQGLIGRAGNDMRARETLFAAQAPLFRDAELLATDRTGADDKYDLDHPFYRLFAALGRLRSEHAALRTGTLIPRLGDAPGLAAFSRIERGERIEYLAAFNNSRTVTLRSSLPTSQPAGAKLAPLFASDGVAPTLSADADGQVTIELAPLQFALWRAESPLPAVDAPLAIALVNPAPGAELRFTAREIDGLLFPSRHEIRAEVTGDDGVAEVTFALQRASRPGHYEIIGVDDTAPYRVFWSRPSDLTPGDDLTFIATVTDLRGRTATTRVAGVQVNASDIAFGIPGATVPVIADLRAEGRTLIATATGSEPLDYQWLRDGEAIHGATAVSFDATEPGTYRVLVHNLAGTVLSESITVVAPRQPSPAPSM